MSEVKVSNESYVEQWRREHEEIGTQSETKTGTPVAEKVDILPEQKPVPEKKPVDQKKTAPDKKGPKKK